MKTRSKLLLVTLATAMAVSATHADTFYTSQSSWGAAVHSISINSIPDPAPSPYVYLGAGDASVTYGPVTYSMSSAFGNALFYNVGFLSSGSPAVVSAQFDSLGIEDILITLPTPVDALAVNYGTFFGENVNLLLSDGSTDELVNLPAFDYTTTNFIGVVASSGITSILLTSTDPILNVGNVYTAIPGAPVPDPSTFGIDAFLALPLGIQCWRRLRGRKRIAPGFPSCFGRHSPNPGISPDSALVSRQP